MPALVLPADTPVQAMTWGDAVELHVAVATTVGASSSEEMHAREQAAFDRGVQQGRSSAMAELSGRIDAAVARAAGSAAELAALAPRTRAAAQDDIVRLSIAIARRILRRELAVDPDALAGIVIAALERLKGREVRRARVHPEDSAAVEHSLRAAGAPPGVTVYQDPSLERGSLIFEMEHGNLDASVWTQLSEIERGLTEAGRRAPA